MIRTKTRRKWGHKITEVKEVRVERERERMSQSIKWPSWTKVSRAAFGDISSTEVTGGLREGRLAEGQWWEQQGRGEGGPADKGNASLELGVSCRLSTG